MMFEWIPGRNVEEEETKRVPQSSGKNINSTLGVKVCVLIMTGVRADGGMMCTHCTHPH